MIFVLSDLSMICTLGSNPEEITSNALSSSTHNMVPMNILNHETVFGIVSCSLPKHDMRCFSLLDKAAEQIDISKLKSKYASNRIGIVLGGCNAGTHEAQQCISQFIYEDYSGPDFKLEQIKQGILSGFLKDRLQIDGPSFIVSTACSSSAKAFQSARNLLLADVCDCVIVGGIDSISSFTCAGFASLEVLSSSQTLPMSENRKGLNLGEGAALFVMEKAEDNINSDAIILKGIGESSDAYHLVSPDPSGSGAISSMTQALKDAKLDPSDIDYINLHGTGTKYNDSMEALAVYQVFGNKPLCASTKSMTGHTLGACGAIELGLSYLMIQNNVVFPHVYDGKFDKELKPINLATQPLQNIEIKNILSNAFAFGGSNVSLIIGKL